MAPGTTNKSWGGRFSAAPDQQVRDFTASVGFDRRLFPHDIRASIAHARMLAQVGVISAHERDQIVTGLEEIRAEIERGEFVWRNDLEDVHMNIEARLTERIGVAGKKLHTGRSRNDQVATDMRLLLRAETDRLLGDLAQLRSVLVDLAEHHAATIMPGFTHLQVAQPVTFGHHMLAWEAMLTRDAARLADARKRINVLPLGSAALAGTSYPIDRDFVAKALDFDALAENSLDAVSDRDFVIEFLAGAALIMTHLSRMSEELILWLSPAFGLVTLPDAYCTGSSIMPQKKNPDIPELVRGKTGRVYGHLMALLTLMKGQPLAYNRDNQEDKEGLFDTVDTVGDCLRITAGMLAHIQVDQAACRRLAARGHPTATDLADYLVRKGVAFRDAHEIVGKAVREADAAGRDLAGLDLETLQRLSRLIDADVFELLTLEGSVAARDHPGGTAPNQVRAAVQRARRQIG